MSNTDPFAQAEQAAATAQLASEADPFAQAEASAEQQRAALAAGVASGSERADPFAAAEATAAGSGQPTQDGPAGTITEAELQTIAREFGVNPDELAANAPFFGLDVEGRKKGLQDYAMQGAGFLGESIALGLPQKAYLARQEKPNEQAALQTLREIGDKRKSGLRTAAELGVGIGGAILGGGGIITGAEKTGLIGAKTAQVANAVMPGAVGAIAGAAHAREGEETGGAAFGFALGVAGQLLFKGIGAGWRKAFGKTAETAEASTSTVAALAAKVTSGADGLDLERRSAQAAAEAIPAARQAVFDSLENAAEEIAPEAADSIAGFAKYLGLKAETLEKAQEGIAAKVAQEGEEHVQKQLANYQQTRAAFDLMGADIDGLYRKEGWGGDRNFFQRARDFFRDGLLTMRRLDDKLGTQLETDVAMEMGEANNRYTVTLGAVTKDISSVKKAMRVANLDSEVLYHALDTGDVSRLTPEQMPAFETARQGWESMRQLANELGLPIEQLAGGTYVKHAVVQPDEYVARLMQRADGLRSKLGDIINQGLDNKGYELLKETDKDLIRAVALFSETEIADGPSFTAAIREAVGGRSLTESFQTRAAAAQLREDGIPEFIREKDVPALMGRWAQNTFKHIFYRDGIANLRKGRDMAVAAGDKDAATYLTNLLADVSGVRQGTLHGATKNAITNFQISMRKAAQDSTSETGKAFHNFLADAPNFMPNLFQQVYPNFLGLKPAAIVMNATQPWMMTMPELGYGYGAPKVFKAYGAAASIVSSGREIVLSPETARLLGKEAGETITTRNPAVVMHNLGQQPMQWSTELRDALRQGIAKSAPIRIAGDALNHITDVSMKAFELSEVMNRAVAMEVATSVTGDLLGKGSARASAGAQAFLANSGSAYRRQAQALIQAGDSVGLENLTRNYITSRTIFNYNRATLSEAGRFMGPILSVFTKWPATIAGDVMEQYRRKGTIGGTAEVGRKYVAPLMAVWAIDRLVLPDKDDSPTTKFILGGGGLTSAAPLGTVLSILTGKIAQPPVVATVGKLTAGIAAGDLMGGAWRAFNGALESFTPGGVLLRSYTDIRDWKNGERSEGTFLNKLAPDAELDERVKERSSGVTELLNDIAGR